jgi:hypothetical protein
VSIVALWSGVDGSSPSCGSPAAAQITSLQNFTTNSSKAFQPASSQPDGKAELQHHSAKWFNEKNTAVVDCGSLNWCQSAMQTIQSMNQRILWDFRNEISLRTQSISSHGSMPVHANSRYKVWDCQLQGHVSEVDETPVVALKERAVLGWLHDELQSMHALGHELHMFMRIQSDKQVHSTREVQYAAVATCMTEVDRSQVIHAQPLQIPTPNPLRNRVSWHDVLFDLSWRVCALCGGESVEL